MTLWEKVSQSNKRLTYFIDIGLHWAGIYYNRMDNTQAYVIAMRKWSPRLHGHIRTLI